MEGMLLPQVPLLGTLALWISVLVMVVAFLVGIPRWAARPKPTVKREEFKKAA